MKIKIRIRLFFFERVPPGIISRRWHALAFRDYQRMEAVMVLWGLHYLVQFAAWLAWRWDVYRHRPSWIDRHVAAAVKRAEEHDVRRFIRRNLQSAENQNR